MTDPIRDQRAVIDRGARLAQRTGYLLYLLAMVAFVVGLVTGFGDTAATVAVVGLVAGTVVLAPAILVTYMVKAAEREDREAGR